MKSVSGLVMIVVAALLAASPASAYEVDLTVWNATQLVPTGNFVKVVINGNTVTFSWEGGANNFATAKNMLDIFWDQAVQNSGPATAPDYVVRHNPSGNAGAFNNANGYPTYVEDAGDHGGDTILTETFTFPRNLATNLTADDFVVHVQYGDGCRDDDSGFAGGSGAMKGGPRPSSHSSCVDPVPEPMTVFLGGTGLLVFGYVARKRLFSRFAS
jgi:hypothetical protein